MSKKPGVRPKLCVIYARVSTKEQQDEGFSLDAQLASLKDYCAKNDLEVAGTYVDAESGSRSGRTQFGKMMEQIAKSDIKIIVCEVTDRLYRNFGDYVKIDDLRTELHFVKEGMVIGPNSRSNDKFIHSIKVCMAKNFSDHLRERVMQGMVEKARQGLYPSFAPIGYLNVQEGPRKTIKPDPVRAPLVRALFDAYAAGGLSLASAAAYAREMGLRTREGRCISRSGIGRMFDAPVYCGMVVWGEVTTAGLHEALVPMKTWEKVQEVMHGRKSFSGYGKHDQAYRGLMKCGHCGCAITAEIIKGRYIYYRCSGGRDRHCPGMKRVKEEQVTEYYAGLFDQLRLTPERLEWIREALRQSLADERDLVENQIAALQATEKRARGQLERLYLDKVTGEVPDSVYASLRQRFEQEISETEIALRAIKGAEVSYYEEGLRILQLTQTASRRFKKAESHVKREIVLRLQSNCIMRDGKPAAELQSPFNLLLDATNFERENGPNSTAEEIWYSTLARFRTALLAG